MSIGTLLSELQAKGVTLIIEGEQVRLPGTKRNTYSGGAGYSQAT
jgi:hypothetical protein